jgi:hypothetical protein
VAIYLDPTMPARHSDTAYSLLAAYLAYAMLITLVVWRAPPALTLLPLITHVIDIFAFSLFMYFTEAPTSPFFVYFTFSLVCATMRWRWPGTLGTAIVSLSLFLAMGFYSADVLQDPEFELNRFIIRSVYLSVMALLLGYMGAYEDSLKRDISQLASWQGVATTGIENTIREALITAAAIIGAPRAVVIWEQSEEPYVYVATWFNKLYRSSRGPPSMLENLVAAPLVETSFSVKTPASPPAACFTRPTAGSGFGMALRSTLNCKTALRWTSPYSR